MEVLAGVMGIQDVDDVTLIGTPTCCRSGSAAGWGGAAAAAGGHGRAAAAGGDLAAAWWAVAFYERHGFILVSPAEKDRLLRRYWDIPERQVETSVVLRQAR